jgi:hypothetical protein
MMTQPSCARECRRGVGGATTAVGGDKDSQLTPPALRGRMEAALEGPMRRYIAAVSGMLAVVVALVSAQTNQLSGTVRDRSGAVLPGVSVTVDGPALDKARIATTDSHGEFTFTSLPPDDAYVVTFTLVGFGFVQKKVAIATDKAATADAVMSVTVVPNAPPKNGFPSNYGVVLIAPQ